MLAVPLHINRFPSMFGNRSMILRSLILGVVFISCAGSVSAQPPRTTPATPARHGESLTHETHASTSTSCPPFLGCPDDYCPKPFPQFWQLPRGETDDYCPKPFPRVCQLPCGGPDDYCRKPMPALHRPLLSDYYRCVNQSCCEQPSPRSPRLTAPR
jgi:hypothetical protein